MRDAGLIVFLNKQDLLERKIKQGRKLEKYFPEYSDYRTSQGDPNSEYDTARLFMKDKVEVKIINTIFIVN